MIFLLSKMLTLHCMYSALMINFDFQQKFVTFVQDSFCLQLMIIKIEAFYQKIFRITVMLLF